MARNLLPLIAGAATLFVAAATASSALAGGEGGGGCGCKPPPPPPPPPPTCHCQPTQNIVVPGVNVFVAPSVNVNVQASANASVFSAAGAQTFVGGGGGASGIIPGPVTAVNLGVGGEDREAYEAMRTRFEKVVIQAFCFDDKEVPHPASQVSPDRDIDQAYAGEVYRCIAGSHMQVTIAPFRDHISFEGGQTLTCLKGEALYHEPGQGAGKLVCRPQIPARDCNERSLLRRFGAGIKVLTLVYTEKYTAYRESSHTAANVAMTLDGGVGGIAY
ncbi:MAG TPA: hypothetical protein VFE13_06060 [Caulobacteraceae bacterium]|nr:hypothetical protein [Caulobacteraceae bacterium]